MKLRVLMDNNTYIDRYYLGEPAVCYYIEDGDRHILLDVGYSDAYLENARRMGIDLSRVTDIVISHGHNDHTGGLQAFFDAFGKTNVRITACENAFVPKTYGELDIGSPLSETDIRAYADLQLTNEPCRISEHVTFLGAIKRQTNFENKTPIGKICAANAWQDDYLFEDTALALETPNGVFLALGCSHSGVCNIILSAQALFGQKRITGLIGGMHLFECDEQTEKTIDFLEKQHFDMLMPCHCTSFAVRAAMSRRLPLTEVGVGMELSWQEDRHAL